MSDVINVIINTETGQVIAIQMNILYRPVLDWFILRME